MRSLLIIILSILFSLTIEASVTCEDIKNYVEANSKSASSLKAVLTKEQWKGLDVLVEYDYEACHDAFSQDYITVKGESLTVFKSFEDRCDGGNTYGAIFTDDLKTAIAHIYDGDIYCEEDWNEEYKASNHTCDLKAEEYAVEKMRQNGFDFADTSSSLKVRSGYVYSYIYVSGVVKNLENKRTTVLVTTALKSCQFGGASISNLKL